MDLAEYFIDEQDITEWLPWGGIVRKNVVRNKDGSFFGVMAYNGKFSAPIPPFSFPKGWSIWSEEQHASQHSSQFYFVLCWNPFWSTLKDTADNVLRKAQIAWKRAPDYFSEELSRFADMIRKADSSCRILEYQELLDFLSFSLSFGKNQVAMPETPLYLDVLLSDDLDAEFDDNSLSILDDTIVVVSLPSCPRGLLLDSIRRGLSGISYRYVRRLLLMDEDDAEDNLKNYTKGWCGNRQYIKRYVLNGIISAMNGFYCESFIFPLSDDDYDRAMDYIHCMMDGLYLPYIMEEYNLKDVWWGSLAGCFRANIRPFISGFENFNEFLIQSPDERIGEAV